jgi:hypothetical protein
MTGRRVRSLLAVWLIGLAPTIALAQVPSSTEAQAIWDAFWGRILAGDLRGAYRFVHPSRLGLPLQKPVEQLQEMARQMQHCRLRPDPLPGSGEDVLFEVHCEHDGEKASLLVGFRQDTDGAWRLTVI